ncbi:hypothetical protein TUBRATIS_23220 [Tubulinosema ratisbonensis]|uniref:Uncharacterized protein n=1 Tax=Tubulinosema ratisbonensis TaxID=291195 RepID=A0A437AJG2_9MICR|nr:hypothetical protein TUBRATIS_23220 [Tubulinosema ratisbonensis]
MIAFAFLIITKSSVKTGTGNMIGSVMHKNLYLSAETETKLELKEIPENMVQNSNSALISILLDGGFYSIQFESNKKFLHMNEKNHKVVLMDLKFEDVDSQNTEFGFKFDFEGVKDGVLISSRGQCLEIFRIHKKFSVKGNKCDPNNHEQLFFVTKVDVYDKQEGENTKDEISPGKYDQEEGPTKNPILHGPNTKRDPYMYGNEPFKGKKII